MDATTKPQYPACCPKCLEKNGWPYAAGTCDRPGVIVVKLRCGTCHTEWRADAPPPVMAVAGLWPRQSARRYRVA
jgi:hypothetical protein